LSKGFLKALDLKKSTIENNEVVSVKKSDNYEKSGKNRIASKLSFIKSFANQSVNLGIGKEKNGQS